MGTSVYGKIAFGIPSSNEFKEKWMAKKHLTLSDDKIVGGVCGGISEYFDIDPIFLRVAWAIALFAWGWGFLLYLIFWLATPEKD